MSETKQRLLNLLQENNLIKESDIPSIDEKGLTTLGINSLTFVKIIVLIEEEFNIVFEDMELNFELFSSLEEIVTTIERKI
ncbi:phosphopantetheine-binding protein [Paenibacillus sp. EKM211P]|uniref:phosphopantetheine-binding protein n=1 Tax=Paenibacillus sp. EKM211P TaxID=1683679 RepID=UPI0013E8F788|nr:phosphopantetheine-binding protein [Paenibacillus sp. EKM211P]KAF6582681.1 acyl carrier protein [Paenibacillus sp. EKM211P]